MPRTFTPKEIASDLSRKTGQTITAKRVRAIMRAKVRANGGVIGQDTPGKGKTYSNIDARMKAQIEKDVLHTLGVTVKATPKARKAKAESNAPAVSLTKESDAHDAPQEGADTL